MVEAIEAETHSPKILEQLRSDLGNLEQDASRDLNAAMDDAGLRNSVKDYYIALVAEPSASQKKGMISSIKGFVHEVQEKGMREVVGKPLLENTKKGVKAVWGTAMGKLFILGTGAAVVSESIQKATSVHDFVTIALNDLVRWSGTSITDTNPLTIITAVGVAAGYLAIPAGVAASIQLGQRRMEARLRRHQDVLELRHKAEQDIKEGKADLRLLVKDNVSILVGKADPSVEILIKKFNAIGLDVVTYWDSENKLSRTNPFWIRTDNNWTNPDNLMRGAVGKTCCFFAEVSGSNDVWLSGRTRNPLEPVEDMTDTEVLDTSEVVRTVVGKDIQIVSVTNPKRKSLGVVAGTGKNPYGEVTVADIVSQQYKNISLLDPDTSVTADIAIRANEVNLPIELYTDLHREREYVTLLRDEIVPEHNKRVEDGEIKKPKLRYREDGDKLNTLTVIYGSDDGTSFDLLRDYLTKIKTILSKNSIEKVGDYLIVVNDPGMLPRLPQEVRDSGKYICVGEIIANAQFNKFIELVNSGAIQVPERVLQNIKEQGLLKESSISS